MLKSRLLLAAGIATAFSSPVLAQANYSELTTAVDWSTAITAIMAVAAVIAGVLVVRKGVRFVLGMLR